MKKYNKEKQKEWARKNPKSRKNTHLKYAYGFSLEGYNKLFEDQKGLCAICNQPERRKFKSKTGDLCVDHCHTTGKIRGLLCADCNNGLGKFKESFQVLERAIHYLRINDEKGKNIT